jgi:hypothetical protein
MKNIWQKENKIYDTGIQDYKYLESSYLIFEGVQKFYHRTIQKIKI